MPPQLTSAQWAWVAGATGLLLLAIAVGWIVAASSRKRQSKRGNSNVPITTRSPTNPAGFTLPSRDQLEIAPPPAVAAVAVLAADFGPSGDYWVQVNGCAAEGIPIDGAYRVSANVGVRSHESMKVTPGSSYRVSFASKLVVHSTTGGKDNFLVGPIFLNAAGKVVGWWKRQPEFTSLGEQRTGDVDTEAPADAATVHIGIHGPYNKAGNPGTGVIEFSKLTLAEIPSR